MIDCTYNILDFETTGFSTDYDRVIEIGVIKIHDGRIINRFQEFVNPEMFIPSDITYLTGITNAMVNKAPKSAEVMPKLKSFLSDELIIAHNASFDSRFFHAELNRIGIYPENDFLCTLLLSRRIYQNLHSHTLEVLCNHLGFVNDDSHRALEDAEVTGQIFSALCEKIKMHSGKTELNYSYLSKLNKIPKKKVMHWLQIN